MAMKAQHWSLSALAVELGKDRRFVGKLLEGVPVASKTGQGEKYLMRDVIAAMMDRDDLDATQEKARKDKMLADKTEIQVRQLEGTLVDAEEMARAVGEHIAAATTRFQAMGPMLKTQLATESDPDQVEKIINEYNREALGELGTPEIADS